MWSLVIVSQIHEHPVVLCSLIILSVLFAPQTSKSMCYRLTMIGGGLFDVQTVFACQSKYSGPFCVTGQMEDTGSHCSDCTTSAEGRACASRATGAGHPHPHLLDCTSS